MSNMPHARFQNTQADLRDCLRALDNDGAAELSDEELKAAKTLLTQARSLIDSFEGEIEDEFDERFPITKQKYERSKR